MNNENDNIKNLYKHMKDLYKFTQKLSVNFSELARQHEIFINQLDNIHNIINELDVKIYELGGKKLGYKIEHPQHLSNFFTNTTNSGVKNDDVLALLKDWLKKINTVKDFFNKDK